MAEEEKTDAKPTEDRDRVTNDSTSPVKSEAAVNGVAGGSPKAGEAAEGPKSPAKELASENESKEDGELESKDEEGEDHEGSNLSFVGLNG